MLENDIFEQWLSDEAGRVLARLKNNEPLSQDDKLIIVLKGQMNHFHHLDVELRQETLALRQDTGQRFEIITSEINTLRQDTERRFEVITSEINTLRQDMDRRFEVITSEINALRQDMDRRFEVIASGINTLRQDMDRRFETVTDEVKQLYRTINAQTWKMISAVGLIVLLGRVIENF
uniref:Uncharacterized protein n=1 Tax=Candidatus Kentrum sp. TC TaxID=2126339 RepID=A0A450Z4M8_9GAMM|nr:MAG: hypothetical protein BECKTC1821D_GA0114238_10632 [Candidatus Kentron sp. TC]